MSQPPKTIKSYKAGIQARTQQRQEEKRAAGPTFPNLAQASMEYDPKRDGATTLKDLAASQRAAEGPRQPGLRPETIAGMQALKEAQDKVMTQQPGPTLGQQPAAQPVPVLQPVADTIPAPAPAPAAEPALTQTAPSPEDEELLGMLRDIQRDVINNEEQRIRIGKAVAPIDLATGLMTGEFVQRVPVIPGAFEVTYRTISTFEHQQLKLYLLKKLRENGDLDTMSGELLGLYQTVASVQRLNSSSYEAHLGREANGSLKFLEPIFEQKLNTFLSFPLPLIHALGVHGAWFDRRVRELFASVDPLKNG